MTLDQLRYFLEAAKFEHVGKAAQSIHISPSAVSGAIAALEDELKCQLFKRAGKRIYVTNEGRYLQGQAELLFGQVNQIRLDLQGKKAELEGRYRLGGSHFLSARFLGKAWNEIQKKFPKVAGEVCSMNTAFVIGDVLNGTLDFGLCFSPQRHPDLKHFDMHHSELLLTVRKNHPILKKPHFKLADLSAYPATIHKSAPGVDVCETHPNFEKFGINPNITCQFDSDDVAIQSLRETNAWSLLPDVVVNSTKDLVPVRHPKDWNAPYYISLISRMQRKEDRIFLMLREQVQALF